MRWAVNGWRGSMPESKLGAMTMPTLVMLGSNEGQPFKDLARWMADNIPGSQGIVEVPNAGHASVRERPEFVLQEFRRFLA